MRALVSIDEALFKQAFDEHYASLLGAVQRGCRLTREDAEDIAQKAFIRMWRNGYEPAFPIFLTLWANARSIAGAQLQEEKRKAARATRYNCDWPLPGTRWIDAGPWIEKAKRAMPQPMWVVFHLVRWCGLSTTAAGRELGLKPKTVEKRLHHADACFRSLVENVA